MIVFTAYNVEVYVYIGSFWQYTWFLQKALFHVVWWSRSVTRNIGGLVINKTHFHDAQDTELFRWNSATTIVLYSKLSTRLILWSKPATILEICWLDFLFDQTPGQESFLWILQSALLFDQTLQLDFYMVPNQHYLLSTGKKPWGYFASQLKFIFSFKTLEPT